MAATALIDAGYLTARLAIDAARNCPFREQFRLALESSGLPFVGAIIFVGVVFEGCGQRVLEVPEIRRRDRMPARADLGFPSLLAHGNSSPDDLVDISQCEGDMIDAGATGTVENENIVVVTDRLTPGEHTMIGIFVTDNKAELLGIECAHRREVGREHDHMSDVDGMRLVMNR